MIKEAKGCVGEKEEERKGKKWEESKEGSNERARGLPGYVCYCLILLYCNCYWGGQWQG